MQSKQGLLLAAEVLSGLDGIAKWLRYRVFESRSTL